MGAAAHLDITGAKGGESKPKTPVEAPDSLQSTNIAKILLAVGEGEFDGEPTDRDIHLDNTPIMDASGNVNFPGVKWEWRRGTVEQDYIQGIPAVENETTVNVELRSDNPFTRSLSNTQLSAVRVRMSWPRLADAVEFGEATAEEEALLTQWKQYRILLTRVPKQPGYPQSIDWPVPPI